MDTQLSERICSTSALYVGCSRGVLLYVCEYPNVEVLLAENVTKLANRYKFYIREVR